MATYPTLPQTFESRRTPQAGLRTYIAEDGTVRAVNLHVKTLYEFAVVHEYLSSVQRDQIVSCYNVNQANSFDFTWQGDNSLYTTIFRMEPNVIDEYGGRFRIETLLLGHAQ